MKSNTCIRGGILAVLVLLAAVQPAAAVLPSSAGLQITLLLADVPAGQTVTDDAGLFTLEGVAAGSYALLIADVAGTMSLRFPLEVTADQAPASVAGTVAVSADVDIGFTIAARVIGAESGGPVAVDQAVVRPRKWNLNTAHSRGRIKVFLQGSGLEGVTTVTLKSASGALPSTDVRMGDEVGTAMAVFGKAAAWAALVPAGTVSGAVIPLEIVVEGPGYSQTFSQDILIIGRGN